MIRALDRKLLRDLWRLKSQIVAIALVIACGITVFLMSLGAMTSLEETRRAYYERYRLADVFVGVKRAPERLLATVREIAGVQAVQSRVVAQVTLDVSGYEEAVQGRLISLDAHAQDGLNSVVLRSGRWPAIDRDDEALASESFAEAHGLHPGDSLRANINGKLRRLTITGLVLSPEYVYAIAPGALMPDDERFGILWVSRDLLAAAFDLDGAFNDLSLTLMRGANAQAVIDRLDRLLARYGSLGAYTRADQVSNFFLSQEIQQLRTLAGFLPSIFLAVGAFLLNITIARLVATERQEIGLMKAFGYGDAAIVWHYLKLVAVISLIGLALGIGGGAVMGWRVTELYAQFYRFPFLTFAVEPWSYLLAAGVCLGAALAGTVAPVLRAARLPPAEAMRPPAPPAYHRGRLAAIGAARHLDQPTLMILRQLMRRPLRALLAAVGIAAALAVLVTSQHWMESPERMVEDAFERARHDDLQVTFFEPLAGRAMHEIAALPGVLAVEPLHDLAVRFRAGQRSYRGAISGLVAEPRLQQVIDTRMGPISLPEDGLVLSRALANRLDVGLGQQVVVEILEEARREIVLRVVGLIEVDLGMPAYARIETLGRALRRDRQVTGALIAADERRMPELIAALRARPAIAAVTSRRAIIDTFRETLADTVVFIVGFYVIFAGLLSAGVAYNNARIALSERGRELASLRVLGFTRGEVAYVLLGEVGLLTLLALPIGCWGGHALAVAITRTMDNELFRIPVGGEPWGYGFSMIVVIAATALSGFLVWRRIRRLDLLAVLKTRE